MRMKNPVGKGMSVMFSAAVFGAVILLVAGNSLAATVSEGKPLPDFKMELASQPDMLTYLGVASGPEFTISQIPSRLIVVEFFSVLCKACHQNAPQVNKIYQVISNDPDLFENVKMLGIALGNDGKMADGYKKTFNVKFPIVNDPDGEIDGLFPDMTTPCLILADNEGRVLFVHEGFIDDPDTILAMIRRLYSR